MPLTQQTDIKNNNMRLFFLICAIILSTQLLNACSPLIVAGTVAGAGATVATDRRSPDNMIEDQAIEIQSTDYLYSHEDFGKKVHVSVTSFNGIVLLVGEVLSEKSKQTIVNKITRMRGVKKVIDAINVKNLTTAADRSNDVWITSKVKSHLIAEKGLLTRSKVITSDSNVYLMGIVSNKEAQNILNIVKEVDGVNSVTPLFESLDGSLSENYSVNTNIKPSNTSTTVTDKEMKEDDITIQPYVLQPAIRINDNE